MDPWINGLMDGYGFGFGYGYGYGYGWIDGSMDRSIDRQVDRYMGVPPVPPAHPHRSLTPRFCFSAAMFLPGMGAALRCRTL